MKIKVIIIFFLIFLPCVISATGRVAWVGATFSPDAAERLRRDGFTLEEINEIDDLSGFDVLVINHRSLSPGERGIVMDFVEGGGGLLFIFDPAKQSMEGLVSEYGVEGRFNLSIINDLVGSPKLVELIGRNASISTKGRGRMIFLGIDEQRLAVTALFLKFDVMLTQTIGWLCQDWHAQETRKHLEKERNELIALGILMLLIAITFTFFFMKRGRGKREGKVGDGMPPSPNEKKKSENSARCTYCGTELSDGKVCKACEGDPRVELEKFKERKKDASELLETVEKKFLKGEISKEEYVALKKTWNIKLADIEEKIIDLELRTKP